LFDDGTLLGVQGPFYIPDQDKHTFFQLYTNCYNAGTHLTLTEGKPSRKWAFFLDCDGSPEKTPTIVKYIKLFKLALLRTIIPATLQFAYGRKIASRTGIEMQTKRGNPSRLHFFVVCPNVRANTHGPLDQGTISPSTPTTTHCSIVLNAHTAKVVRSYLIQSCVDWSTANLPKPLPEAELVYFIDPVLQSHVGLRMYGSLKNDPNDTDYVQPNKSVTPETLNKYSIHPIGIAKKPVTQLTNRIKRWFDKYMQDTVRNYH
jgi:hypothetical protein